MKAVLSWILEYLPSRPSQAEVIDALIRSGTEVDAVDTVPAGVVAAHVLELTPIPKSTRGVRIARIDTGAGEVTLLTGAPNVSAGDLVPYAKPGVMLPGWQKPLATRVMFGIESPGMLLSESELGLGEAADGLLLLEQGSPGDPLETLLQLPVVLTVEPTTNRPDLLSHLGLAREVAAVLRIPLAPPSVQDPERMAALALAAGDNVAIQVADPSVCGRFIACAIDGIQPMESPTWMRTRLELAGMRSMGLAVDITNYVALETGQPLHAFDRDKLAAMAHDTTAQPGHDQLAGNPPEEINLLAVRSASNGARLTCLDGVERTLSSTDIVVANGDQPISLAGLMGGEGTAVSDTTTRLLLEAATWPPSRIRETSNRLALRTEASYRFEKGLSPELADYGAARALFLFAELMGARPVSLARWEDRPHVPESIEITDAFLDGLLGFHPGMSESADILGRLGFSIEKGKDPSALLVTPPAIRLDVVREVDVAEEIGRVHGYDSLPAKLPALAPRADLQHGERPVDQRTRDILVGAGFSEVINYSFVAGTAGHPDTWIEGLAGSASRIPVLNPLSEEFACMRNSLLPALLTNLADNLHHNVGDLALFEYGKVFQDSLVAEQSDSKSDLPALPKETWMVGLGASAPSAADAVAVFRHTQATLACLVHRLSGQTLLAKEPEVPLHGFHEGRCAELYLENGERIGILGEAGSRCTSRLDVGHRLIVGELALTSFLAAEKHVRYFAPARWPAVASDLSIKVPVSAKAGDAIACIRRAGGELLESCSIYDEYHGKPLGQGWKAWSFHLTFRNQSGNMSREEAAGVEERIRIALAGELGANPR